MKKNHLSQYHGQTLVEFALILPVLLFLAVVIFDFGRAVYYYNAIQNAAREGARHGVVSPNDTSGMKKAATDYAVGLGLQPENVTAGWSFVGYIGKNKIYDVKVSVSYCFAPVTPFVDQIINNAGCSICGCSQLHLSSDSVMRTETMPE